MPTCHRHPTPSGVAISGLPNSNRPGNHRGDPPRAFPHCLHGFAAMLDVRDTTDGGLPYGGIPSTILCRGGLPVQHRTALLEVGIGEFHQKQATYVSMYPRDGMFHMGGDAI